MAVTVLSSTAGQLNAEGDIVQRVFAAQTNDATHVALNPEQGRIELLTPEGCRYTSLATVGVSTSSFIGTLIKQTQ